MFSAPSIWGPWTQHPNPCRGPKADKTFMGQSTFVLTLSDEDISTLNPPLGRRTLARQEPSTLTSRFIFMADIWRPQHPRDARYIWLPIEFEDGKPVIRWRDEWKL